LIRTDAEKLDTFFSSLRSAPTPLLLLDYDGTLADFRIDRFTARPWSGVRELLTEIQKDNRTRLRVITGRPAGEINPLLQLPSPVEVWGLHGAERLYPDGRRELQKAPPEATQKLEELRTLLRQDAFGGLFEDKPNAVVMHWRGHTPQRSRVIEQKTRALFEPASRVKGLSLLPFESGIELRVGRDKGGAARAIVDQVGPHTPVAFLGDDLTDESAFRWVNRTENPHVTVLVRRASRDTSAEIWLKPPEELRWFLKRWLNATTGEWGTSSGLRHIENASDAISSHAAQG
jgi:trehalose 6-phosphate phosphatase